MKRKKRIDVVNLFIHIVMLVCCTVIILPLIGIVSISLSNEDALFTSGYSLLPQELNFNAYKYIFGGNSMILQSYLNTIFIVVVGTLLHLIVSSMLAYALSRSELRFRSALMFYVVFLLLFSGGLVPWYLVMTKVLHLKNTIWAMILPYTVSSANIVIMRNFFATIPSSLIEAARVDGASEFKTFRIVVLPLAKPILATITLLVGVYLWNDWYTCSLLIDKMELFNLQFLLQTIMTNMQYISANPMMVGSVKYVPSESARMAMCVLSVGPVILFYPFVQKYFQQGLTLGAVKE